MTNPLAKLRAHMVRTTTPDGDHLCHIDRLTGANSVAICGAPLVPVSLTAPPSTLCLDCRREFWHVFGPVPVPCADADREAAA